MRTLALVTAKSQSTRVADKNNKIIVGKPLYKWTTDFLVRNKRLFDCMAFSSDEPGKFEVPKNFELITRPKVLCEDNTPHVLSVKHGLIHMEKKWGFEFEYTVLFQPTNPFRTQEDISRMLHMLETSKPLTARTYYIDENIKQEYIIGAKYEPDLESDKVLVRSGSMYAYHRSFLMGLGYNIINPESAFVVVPKRRGYNINTEEDFMIVESLMKGYKCELKQ